MRAARNMPPPPPAARFAVVLYPGTDSQRVDTWCSTLRGALEIAADFQPEIPCDVMRVLADGSLTTEL